MTQNASGKVGVVLVNWNGKDDSLECIGSLGRAGYSPLDIIMVDNGSTDGSVAAVRAAYPGVDILENRENTGFCRANNQGIARAIERGAEYLLALNTDTVVEPGAVTVLKKAIDADSRIACVNPVIGVYGREDEWYFYGTMIDWGNGDLCALYPRKDVADARKPLETDFATWCAAFMRARTYLRAGGLDERFFAYYEDTEWSLRCRRLGLKTVLLPSVLVRHKVSRSGGGPDNPMTGFYLARNRLLFMRLHASFPRKLQFASCYARELYRQSRMARAGGKVQLADAMLDGLWTALNGRFGTQRLAIPDRYRDKPPADIWMRTFKAVV